MITPQNYASFFESIDKETSLEDYKIFFDLNAEFIDPFNSVTGVEKIYNVFQHMYKSLDNPSFIVDEIITNDNIAYIRWEFIFSFKNRMKKESFTGVSRVVFNSSGKAVLHEDYWDSSKNIYEKIPVIKYFMKLLKRQALS